MYRNQNANLFAYTLSQQASQQRLHKDEALYDKTGDLDHIYDNDLGEFNVAAGALGEALKTLGSATTGPMMHHTATALSWLAGSLDQISAAGLRPPTIAATAGVGTAATALAGAGWLGKKLFDGFGLKGSAAALVGSAEALDAAAARLGAAGGIHGGPGGPAWAVGQAAGAAETTAEGAGAGGLIGEVVNGGPGVAGAPIYAAPEIAVLAAATLGAGLVAGSIAVGVTEMVKARNAAQGPGKGGLCADATAATRADDQRSLEEW